MGADVIASDWLCSAGKERPCMVFVPLALTGYQDRCMMVLLLVCRGLACRGGACLGGACRGGSCRDLVGRGTGGSGRGMVRHGAGGSGEVGSGVDLVRRGRGRVLMP